ncbi:MAG: adenylate/guanylate cyclase domain-containing protein [Verrucomicrobiota bacterium]
MKLKPAKLAPALIAAGVIALVCLVRIGHLDLFERLECLTYDMRVRESLKFSPSVSTNLGFIDINDDSIVAVQDNSLGYAYGLYWPRQVYGRLVEELKAQHVKAVALDVVFGEIRHDHPSVHMANDKFMESDEFFALQLRRAGNVILADTTGVTPPDLFRTNALALGDISTDTNKDSDGVLRRAQAFRVRRNWHPLFQQVASTPDYGVDLAKARIEPSKIILKRTGNPDIEVPLDENGNFDLADFVGDKIPRGMAPRAKPFTDERIWNLGIVLAAQELHLDLTRPDIDLDRGTIRLRGPNEVERVIPIDRNGAFYIDWCLTPNDQRLTKEPIHDLLRQDKLRLEEQTNSLSDRWAGKLAVVGSSATGNDLTDRGATPLESDTLLASEHWNVANSIITGRFVRRTSPETDLLIIVALGIVSAILTWKLRAQLAFLLVTLMTIGYMVLSNFLYVQHRYWLPVVLPVLGAQILVYVCLVTWKVVFERAEQRRVKSVFSKIVSPNIVHELLQAEKLSLGGARREVTVLFADVRGFTEFTDKSQEQAASFVAAAGLQGAAADAFYDEQARETLATVNTYLALVADMVKKNDGTLDKYIGDCVMAFWGSPTPNSRHAVCCVRAAMDAQRAVFELNRKRTEENHRRELENIARKAAHQPPRPLLPILLLGSGINTGMVTVGLMGSESHLSNYTVFGREVNLASRLESLSGQGRILITESTRQHLLRDDPALAAACVALPDANIKGIRLAVKVYEIPWLPPGTPAPETAGTPADRTSTTTFTQRERA